MAGIFSKYRNPKPKRKSSIFSPTPFDRPNRQLPDFEKQQQDKSGFRRGPNDSFKQFNKDSDDFFGK